jgi:hypothetical protein
MSYEWYTAKNVGVYPPTGAGNPPWWTPGGVPKAIVRCASPNGNGDILERVEVWGQIAFRNVDWTHQEDGPSSLMIHLMGEVGSSSSTPPDPSLTGAHDFAFTGSMDWTFFLPTFGSPLNTAPVFMRASTNGYQTSKARRGPESYGSVAPYFNLGIMQENDIYFDPTQNGIQSFWAFYVRCLWRTP